DRTISASAPAAKNAVTTENSFASVASFMVSLPRIAGQGRRRRRPVRAAEALPTPPPEGMLEHLAARAQDWGLERGQQRRVGSCRSRPRRAASQARWTAAPGGGAAILQDRARQRP